MDFQKVDLFKPILALHPAPAPIAIKIGVMPQYLYTQGGTSSSVPRAELYVRVSALPEEMQARVKSAIDVIAASF